MTDKELKKLRQEPIRLYEYRGGENDWILHQIEDLAIRQFRPIFEEAFKKNYSLSDLSLIFNREIEESAFLNNNDY